MVVSVGALDSLLDGNRSGGAFRSTASSSWRIWKELLSSMSSSLVLPLPAYEKQVLVPEPCAMRSRGNILKPTFIIGFQVSSIVFSLRSTRIWMEVLLYAIRGSSSLAKCLGYSKVSIRDTRTRTRTQVHPEKHNASERQHSWSNVQE
jgi:hypothetical protein